MKIPFNKPYLTGKELVYIEDAVTKGKISGNGYMEHSGACIYNAIFLYFCYII